MTKIAHLNRKTESVDSVAERAEEQLTKAVRATAGAGADAANESAQLTQRATEAVDDLSRKARTLAEDSPEIGRAFQELLGEQTRQNVDAFSAFARAVNWAEIAEAQSRLLAGSLQRISQFNARYRDFLLRGMTAAVPSPRR